MKVRIYPNCRKPNLENVWNCIACGETLSLGSLVDIENESTIKFLDELRNEDTSTRNDAIKKIINDKINDDQIIITLKDVVENDPSIAVRNFACAALDVFGVKYSTIDELVEVNSKNSEDNNSQTNETVNNPVNWLVIGLLAGLIQGLVLFFLVSDAPAGILYTLCIGPVGITCGMIGAYIGKKDKESAWFAAFGFAILGAGISFALAAFSCIFCM